MATLLLGDPPQALLHTLTNADGSATYSAPHQGYKIIAGVNYPVEVPYRSDEIPESTFIEVNLRPHNGVGMVKERHVENLVKRTLQALILGEQTPRTMLQVTLQVVSVETDESLPGGVKGGGRGETYLDVLASAFNAAILGCLDAGVQMSTIAAAAVIGLGRDSDQVVVNPGVLQRKKSSSLHVFALTKDGKTLLMESEGKFSMGNLKQAEQAARLAVLGHLANDTNASNATEHRNGDVAMNGTENSSVTSMLDVMRKAMEARVIKDESWRQD
ncbi:exosome non-catalytic core subunit rrp46 [Cladophialophora chaetospira]|uniref:Exosome non-catalytic core subunit rrp46 n=1 Tax=Cladophialophora chaetospira TaxID=386627 RepID=A0AA38XJN1_9EURO|nr:exosome non-catalytic core subunit rrp46 [Cladophialophora chaetospira]